MNVIVAEKAGFCFGVNRAVDTAVNASSSAKKPVAVFGELVHNPVVVKKMEALGVSTANALPEIRGGTIIIRAHGIPPSQEEDLRRRCEVIDATCPFVKKAQNMVKKLSDEGYQLVIIGESDHPEVNGLRGYAKKAIVLDTVEEAEKLGHFGQLGVVVQTTQNKEKVGKIIAVLFKKADELRVFNTICSATEERQEAARKTAKEVDVMVVVGGKNSGNTARLRDISSEVVPTYLVESADELKRDWFKGKKVAGVTAGASTPQESIDEVIRVLESF